MFTGETESNLPTIVRSIKKEDEREKIHIVIDGKIYNERGFATWPRNKLKDSLISGFSFFNQICSIGVGLFAIFSVIKNIIDSCISFILIRKIGDSITQTISYFMNPNAYFIYRLPKTKKEEQKEENALLSRNTSESTYIQDLKRLNDSLHICQMFNLI